ncbi:tetratricopeptide repeat protein [Rickettsia sibirica]
MNDYKAHLNKCLTLEKLGKYDLSLESYNKALDIQKAK